MADLPTGTVTFLFTDIEGSTQLWEQHPQAMPAALAQHHALLRAAIDAQAGVVFQIIGDAFCAAFPTAPAALRAALLAQRALRDASWGSTGRIRVRMALHTAAVALQGGDYPSGPHFNRLARLLNAGHGGQVLLSLASAVLLREQLPVDAVLHDLGAHRLKDLSLPEQIFQLVTPDLRAEFPPLKTLDPRRSNLPAQSTPLIGRAREVAGVCSLIRRDDVRLLTLTGPGGTGKTRLGLQVAAELLDDFADGVWFVNLAPISDPSLVATTIAHALSVPETASKPIEESLRAFLRVKRTLLVLDNFEQILDAAPLVAELLAAVPGLKVLVTSRAVLHLYGEHEVAVPPLALPDLAQPPSAEQLTQYEAVRLFIERAQAARADFAVTNDNAPAVAEICHRLDGLPLAIELAAARVKLFPPQALLTRLDQRLKFLTGGARDLPERQQTIRNTIDWSYQLLDAGERALITRLGVFVGGCTIEAAEAVCNAEGNLPLDIVDGLAALVDKSLLKQFEGIDGEPRFTMLETIREYALELLVTSGELEALRQRHAAFFVTLAETEQSDLSRPQYRTWMDRLEIEHPNLRTALVWSRTEADGITGLRLVVALDWFWRQGGYLSEGRGWLADALAPRAGGASWPDTATSRLLRAKALARLADQAGWQNDHAAAQPAYEESLALFRELGDTWNIANTLGGLGMTVLLQGDYERSGALLEESLVLFRQLQDTGGIAWCFFFMGNLAYAQGNLKQAGELWEKGLSLFRQLDNTWMIASSLLDLGILALDQGDDGRAGLYVVESLTLLQELGERWQIVLALEVCAGLTSARGHQRADAEGAGRRAARLFGAAEALRETLDAPLLSIYRDHYQRGVAATRALLDDTTFTAAWAEGRAMSLEQAVAEALNIAA